MKAILRLVWAGWLLAAAPGLWAAEPAALPAFAAHVLVPQSRAHSLARVQGGAQVTGVEARVSIFEQTATTTLEISLVNPGNQRIQAEMLVPVPEGAALRGFTFQGASSEPTAQLLPHDEARRIYDSIVAKMRDPALLEFVGCNLVRTSVFPVEPRGAQKVQIVYEHLLSADGGRVDYVLPRTEAIDYRVPWNVTVNILARRPIATVYSPSHALRTTRPSSGRATATIAPEARTEPGSFRMSYLVQDNGVSASLFAYPDPRVNGGYFLFLGGLPAQPEHGAAAVKREVTLVLDRSGSMNGEKLDQAREAARQVLAGLDDGEAFNLIVYNDSVESFSRWPVLRSDETVKAAGEYLKNLRARGGTNIHDALLEALRQPPTPGTLPIVLFLTDGLPTMGPTSEVVIRDLAAKGNPHRRRVFTFGVGTDVNAPLLDKIAAETRAKSAYVLPNENVEVQVSGLFKRLSGPVLAQPELTVVSAPGAALAAADTLRPRDAAGSRPVAVSRAHDLMPARLPDLFEGDQLVLLGQYEGDAPLCFELRGEYYGRPRTFRFTFAMDKATTKNAFVPRLWASRKIGLLVDAIRQRGADGATGAATPSAPADPRMKELVDEIVRLSTEFGILTEYTAFLARDGTDLSRRDQVLAQTEDNLRQRVMQTRSGLGAINQSLNNNFQQSQALDNRRNVFFDERMNRVEVSAVQQVNDLAFYQRGGQWVDSRLAVQDARAQAPRRVIESGSEEFRRLLDRLASQNRNGTLALGGDILVQVDGEAVLVKAARK